LREGEGNILSMIRSKRGLLIFDFLLILIIILIGLPLGADYFLIAAFIIIIPGLLITGRKHLIVNFMVATVIAMIWMIIARGYRSP